MNQLQKPLALVTSVLVAGLLASCNSAGNNSLLAGPINPPNRPAGTVMGQVVSSVDGAPIPNAVVIVESEVGTTGGFPDNSEFTFGIQTAVDGTYDAANTPVGLLTVRALAKGYRTSVPVQYALATNGVARLDFVLSPGEGDKPDGSAYDPDFNPDGRNAFPWNYDGNFFSYRPDDD